MRKIIIVLLLLTLNMQNLNAFAEIGIPKWEDRCPKEYLNSKYDDNIYWMATANWERALGQTFLVCSVVGWPVMATKMKQHKVQLINNYWVRKKELFEKDLKFCSSFDNPLQKDYCYKELDNNYNLENNMKLIKYLDSLGFRAGLTNKDREYRLSL